MLKHLFTLDDESTDILKQLPEKKKSEFVRAAIKLKAKTLENEPKPEEKPIPVVRIRI